MFKAMNLCVIVHTQPIRVSYPSGVCSLKLSSLPTAFSSRSEVSELSAPRRWPHCHSGTPSWSFQTRHYMSWMPSRSHNHMVASSISHVLHRNITSNATRGQKGNLCLGLGSLECLLPCDLLGERMGSTWFCCF